MPVYNGLTYLVAPHPDARRLLDHGEASGKPYHVLGYAYVGDCRFNMGRSLLVMGALMGSDVRRPAPPNCIRPQTSSDLAQDIAGRTGAHITLTDDPLCRACDFIHTDVWVSLGEAKDVWT